MNKGTYEGTEEEIGFVKELNRNKISKFWEILGIGKDPYICFAVHVTRHKLSKIIKRFVKPKADIYIACGDIPREYLERNDFYLDEEDAKIFSLDKINFSGISVKRRDSTRYQILKMNPPTFKRVFGSYELGAGASIYCSKRSYLKRNVSVLEGWHTNWEKFEKYFCFIPGIELIKREDVEPEIILDIVRKVKDHSNKKIIEAINTNKRISDFVFKGIGNFDEPFTAHWIYEKGALKKTGLVPFSPTTGSGRSRGDFTIVIKPKL